MIRTNPTEWEISAPDAHISTWDIITTPDFWMLFGTHQLPMLLAMSSVLLLFSRKYTIQEKVVFVLGGITVNSWVLWGLVSGGPVWLVIFRMSETLYLALDFFVYYYSWSFIV